MVVGSVVDGSGASINAGGGSGASAGGAGRFLLGNNAAGAFAGSVTGASPLASIGTRDANPFVGGSPSTPFVPNLTDSITSSAEVYGLGDATLNAASLAANLGSLPLFDINGASLANASAGLFRLHSAAGTTYDTDFAGFDMLVLLNLSNDALTLPELGIEGAVSQLIVRGYTRNAAVGGSGGAVGLSSLLPGEAYVTLVPSSAAASPWIAGDVGGTGNASASGASLVNGQALYLVAVPEPGSLLLAALAGLGALLMARRTKARRPA